MMKNQKAPEEKGSAGSSEYLGGAYLHGLALAKGYGVGVESAEREARRVAELERKALALPGGATVRAADVVRLEATIRETEAGIARLGAKGYKPERPEIQDRRAHLQGLKTDLDARRAALDGLPQEALLDPVRVLVEVETKLQAARARCDVEEIVNQASERATVRAGQEQARAELAGVQTEIRKAAGRAHDDLARSLFAAFGILESRLRVMTTHPKFEAAPELLDVRGIEALWREVGKVVEAFHLLHTAFRAPDPWALFFAAVPEPLWNHVGQAIGLAIPRRLRDSAMREAAIA